MKNSLAPLVVISILIAITSQRVYSQQSAAPHPSPTAAATSTQITTTKQLAELADSMEIKATIRDRINPPIFVIREDTFVFYEGSIPQLGDGVITPRRFPILIPLARKLQLDDLRQLLREHPEANTIQWQNAFKLADALIEGKMLGVIASGTLSGDDLISKLYEYNASITKLFERTARDFAASRNLQLQRPGLLSAATHTVPVKFVLNPQEGQLFVIPKTVYSVKGSLDELWRPIIEPDPRLGGEYYFKIKWPDGSTTRPSLLKVERAGQVFNINQ